MCLQTPEIADKVLDKSALLFCARKVSAVAGDMRKAMDICRRSVELTQIADRKQDILKLKGWFTLCVIRIVIVVQKGCIVYIEETTHVLCDYGEDNSCVM